MEKHHKNSPKNKLKLGALLITIGIVYGDIGTSPLYVMKSIMHSAVPNTSEFILGVLSSIIWALTLVTTIKYIAIVLRASNHGEGGIFSLYTLVRNQGKWLLAIAIIGGSALLADSVLTPAVSITSAVEGLMEIKQFQGIINQENIIVLVLIIIGILFAIQRFGTDLIGKLFGPIMFFWFAFLGTIGVLNISTNLNVLKAINPMYAINLFTTSPGLIFLVLGSVLLAVTGAESIYSDLGHVGKTNIRVTWPFVKTMLVLNYLGQGAWILEHPDNMSGNPFYQSIPENWLMFSVVLATMASFIASQALITGTYTLISEAIALNLFPKINIRYPSKTKGQVYIPTITLFLWAATSTVVLFFKSSSKIEAAYGLAIVITMIQTTTLLYQYMLVTKKNKVLALALTVLFYAFEILLLIAALGKFMAGGYVALIIATAAATLMFIWYRGSEIKADLIKEIEIKETITKLDKLRKDTDMPLTAMNIAYLSSNNVDDTIDRNIAASLLNNIPKRAQVYWFINLNILDDPYTATYDVNTYGTDFFVSVQLNLGFRVEQNVDLFIKQIAKELIREKCLKPQKQKYSLNDRQLGDFKYIIIQEKIGAAVDLKQYEKLIMRAKFFIKKFTGDPTRWFGLKYANTSFEVTPLAFPIKCVNIQPVDHCATIQIAKIKTAQSQGHKTRPRKTIAGKKGILKNSRFTHGNKKVDSKKDK